jgi:hypothetical protein
VSQKATPHQVDQRKATRHGVLRQGEIKVGRHKIYCAIRNLSMRGAKLEVGVKLPKEFQLLIDGVQAGLLVDLKWQKGEHAGITFKEPLSTADLNAARLRARLASKRP